MALTWKPEPWFIPAVQRLATSTHSWTKTTVAGVRHRFSSPTEQLVKQVYVVRYVPPEEIAEHGIKESGYYLKVRLRQLYCDGVLQRDPALIEYPYMDTHLVHVPIDKQIYDARTGGELHFVDLFVKFDRDGIPVGARLIGSN